jgi:putative PIN family toxin of toxin-antitoxin system
MAKPRIVVDTNVFAAALTSSTGSNRQVIRACLSRSVVPLMGMALVHEYESVASRPAIAARCPLTVREREQLVDAYLSVCEWVRIAFLWRPNLPDEADNHLIELAVAGGASAVVTNNVRDLRRGELVFPGIRILTPARFLKALEISP